MAAAFLGKKLCPALSGCGFDQVGVLGPEEGAAGIGSDICPRSQTLTAALPGLEGIWGSPMDARLPAGLPLSYPSAVWAQAPTHSVELPLGVWPGARHWGEACLALGQPVAPVEAATAVERDRQCATGCSGSRRQAVSSTW